MRNRNKPAQFRRSNEHVAAVSKRRKDASPGGGEHSKIVANEKPVQLDNVHNAEDMDNIDPSLLFHDEDDYNKLQAMKEVDRELILSRCFEQLKMKRDMNAALKAAEDKEKEKSAEIKEKATATDFNEEEVSVDSNTDGAGDESEKNHILLRVMQIERTSPPIIQSPMNQMTEEEQSPMILMTEEELAMHDDAASAAQKL
jgi:hypothetical protein